MIKFLLILTLLTNVSFAQHRPVPEDYNFLFANTSLYVSMFKYMTMEDAELEQHTKVFIANLAKKDVVELDSKEFIFEQYKNIHNKVVNGLLKVKTVKDKYYAYQQKIFSLEDRGLIEAYMAITEYLYRNYKEELLQQFTDYDALGLRTNYGLLVGFLGEDPTKTNTTREVQGINLLYGPVLYKLKRDKINPKNLFDEEIISALEQKAEEHNRKDEFEKLLTIDNNKDAKSQLGYSESRVEEILFSGGVTNGDIEPLRQYAKAMIEQGKINNAVLAISTLKASSQNVSELTEALKLKQGTIVSTIYCDASDISIATAVAKYLNLDQEKKTFSKQEKIKNLYEGTKRVSRNINSTESISREDAEFLNEALLPYLYTEMDAVTEELKSDVVKPERAEKLEKRLSSYVLGANICSDMLLAAPRLTTGGLYKYSPYRLEQRKETALLKAKEVVKDKTKFETTVAFKGQDAAKMFKHELKDIFFTKGY